MAICRNVEDLIVDVAQSAKMVYGPNRDLLIGRLLDQQNRYPDSAPYLVSTALPLLAVAEHDAIPFAMMHYHFKKDLVPDGVDGSDPWAVMNVATLRASGMPVREFGDELFRVRDKLPRSFCRGFGTLKPLIEIAQTNDMC